MNPQELLGHVSQLLWNLVADEVAKLAALPALAALPVLADEAEPALAGRLLEPLAKLPDEGLLTSLLRDVLGDLPAEPLRVHGWQPAPNAPRGLALVLTQPSGRAVLGCAPGPAGPVVDVVVTAGADLDVTLPGTLTPWSVRVAVSTDAVWNTSFSRGVPAPPTATGRATVTVVHADRVTWGSPAGPGASMSLFETSLTITEAADPVVTVAVHDFTAAVLPPDLAALIGGKGATVGPSSRPLTVRADRTGGIQFADGGLKLNLPMRLNLPGISTRGFGVELGAAGGGLGLTLSLSALAQLPGLPLSALLDGVGLTIPIDIGPGGVGVSAALTATMPTGIGVNLALPPVSGGGTVAKRSETSFAGTVHVDLGIVGVEALGLLELKPLSFLVLLGLELPYPGIQLGFGFALDAVGGIVGVNRRVDVDRLRGLVQDGNAGRILFPGNDVVEHADEITRSLEDCFPVARGRFVVGPMVRINWGGRIVTLAAAVLLDLPEPVRIVLLGRLVIALPDPAVPLILLQASVFGRIEPGVPLVEFLVSLNGSWIVGYPLTGQIYVLFRGGGDPAFVLSAGGFHPRYPRPAGVPALDRLAMNIGGGIMRLRAEAYLALTSNSLQFGAQLHLDATIAGCGIEGDLGLDALCVWEPVLFFSVHVHAGVAVLAFGHRLASVGLDFTLEGPGEWHAFGTGSISILFWDVSLDFDVRWGSKPALTPAAADVFDELAKALRRREAWTVERTHGLRTPLRYSDAASADLAAGRVAEPDVKLTFDQNVVPLRREIQRFHRISVPPQTWEVAGARLATDDKADLTRSLRQRFVPGEFFAMTDDDQLVAPAFEEIDSGFALTDDDVVIPATRLADDTYETSYQVDPDWFPPAQPPRPRVFGRGIAWYWIEAWARPLGHVEQLDRWRSIHAALRTPMVVNR